MNDSILHARMARVEQLFDQLSVQVTRPDLAAVWGSLDRIATFLLTVWRVAAINGVSPSALGFSPPEGFALPPAPSSAATEQWHVYRESIWDNLIEVLTDDDNPDAVGGSPRLSSPEATT